jgi:hypothetical protein
VFAVKFLYAKTLQKPWPTLKILRPRRREKLPVVLDPEEAKRLLAVKRSRRSHVRHGQRTAQEAVGLDPAEIPPCPGSHYVLTRPHQSIRAARPQA